MSLRRFYESLFRKRLWVLLAVGAAVLLSLVLTTHLRMQEDILQLLPSDYPAIAEFKRVQLERDRMDQLIVMIGPADDATTVTQDLLVASGERLARDMRESGLFKEVIDRREMTDFVGLLDWLRSRRAALFTAEDEAWLAGQSSAEALRTTLATWQRLLATNPAPYMSQSLYQDPFGYDGRLMEKLQRIMPYRGAVSLRDGRVFTADGRQLLIQARPLFASTDSQHARALVDFMDGETARLQQDDSAVSAAWISGHRFSLVNADWMKRDMTLTLTLSMLAVGLCAVLVYRRPLLIALTFVPTVFGGILALGTVALFRREISAISVGSGSIMVGITADLGIYVLYHLDRIDRSIGRGVVIGRMLALFRPLLFCAATTLVAFVALMFSDLPGYRDMGLCALLGYSYGTLIALFVLPLVLGGLGKASRPRARLRLDRLLLGYFDWCGGRRRALAVFVAALTLFCAFGLARVRYEGDYRKMGATTPAIEKDMAVIQQAFGSILSASAIAVRDPDLQVALRENERVAAVLEEATQNGETSSVTSIAPILPSLATQQENVARWQGFWSRERTVQVRQDLGQAAAALRIRGEVFDGFFDGLAKPSATITPEDAAKALPAELLATSLCSPTKTDPDNLVLTSVRPSDGFDPIEKRLRAAGVTARVQDGPHVMSAIVAFIYAQMNRLALLTAVLFVAALLLFERTLHGLFRLSLPIAVNLVWCFGLMGWLDIRINLINSLVIVFLFGIIVDYAIFMTQGLDAWRRGNTEFHAATATAVGVSAVTTMAGFAVLIVARHPALHSIGEVTLIGMISGLAAVYLIVPILDPSPSATRQRRKSR